MKKIILSVFIAITLYSCCKEYCNPQPILFVSFNQLRAVDTDSIYIFRYQQGTQVQTDSTFKHSPAPENTHWSTAWVELFPGSDYKIRLLSLNTEYIITDIQTQSNKCSCSNSENPIVSSYKVNGQLRQGQILNIP